MAEEQKAKPVKATSPDSKAARLACRKAVGRVVADMPLMFENLSAKAKEGSVQHAKFLLEWAGLMPEEELVQEVMEEIPAEEPEPLTKLLLDTLGISPE